MAVLRGLFARAEFGWGPLDADGSLVALPESAASFELEGPAEDPDVTELAGTIRAEDEEPELSTGIIVV